MFCRDALIYEDGIISVESDGAFHGIQIDIMGGYMRLIVSNVFFWGNCGKQWKNQPFFLAATAA